MKQVSIFLLLLLLLGMLGLGFYLNAKTKNKKAAPSIVASETAAFSSTKSNSTGFDFNKPDKVIHLPIELKEISGLTFLPQQRRLGAIQDEKGYLFEIDIATGMLANYVKFGSKGDYEGVASSPDKQYIVRSDGLIIETALVEQGEKPTVQQYNTDLSQANDVEGLCYLPSQNSLLIACKERAGRKKHHKGQRYIYTFDLDKKELAKKVFLKIKTSDIKAQLGVPFKRDFKPSGIAVSPIDQSIFILSSIGKLLLHYSKEKKLLNAIPLTHKIYPQPEGITFDPQGNLYISSEGKSGSGTVMVFER